MTKTPQMFKPIFAGSRDEHGARVVVDSGDGFEPFRLPPLEPGEARHSPTGFEWSYHGSGPAELARALLIAALPEQAIVREPTCYQAFKRDVVARLPKEGWILLAHEIVEWFTGWQAKEGPDREGVPR